ncbi:hypothetical protein HY003_01285 [Candidatus Saccharibacteria bacterium]|nr:hypothetical protein [Candidatus Saccharibacteria bacterium]MBI3337911.1 hypothetical protein [Candidatus Saccharibacteria bacterium]
MFGDLLRIVGDYVLILALILLFMLPFYLVYYLRRNRDGEVKLNLSRHLENFFLSRQANYLIFFWAMGEALIWFVIPEFLLLLMVFMRIRRKRELLVYDLGGTMAGTIVAFFIHASPATIAGLPYVQPAMVEQTMAWYDKLGVWGLIYQPFSGVPYKVFTLTATAAGLSLVTFVVIAVLVRMSRYLVAFGLFVALYPGLHRLVSRNYVKLFLVAVFIFSLLLLRVSNIFGPGYQVH